MRSLPLTDKSKPGGRPRESRAPHNAFSEWLMTCGLTPGEVAKKLKLSVSSIYNARNGYFSPGRKVANRIAKLTDGKVPASSWDEAVVRERTDAAPKVAVKRTRKKSP